MFKNLRNRVATISLAAAAAIAVTAAPVAANAAAVTPVPTVNTLNVVDTQSGTPCVVDFTDVAPNKSFYRSIGWMACTGLTAGYADGSFGVNKPITRGEVASFLYRMSGDRHNASNPVVYKDVHTNASHGVAISWMKSKKITGGYADGSFGKNKPITRGELTAFISRFAGETAGYKAPAKSQFKDMTPKSAFYKDISWIASTGMIGGYADGTFKPKRNVTRGETSKFLYSLETKLRGEPKIVLAAVKTPIVKKASGTRYTTAKVNVRSGPGTNYKVIGSLAAKKPITLTGVSGKWYRYGKNSWVSGSYLTTKKPVTTPAKPAPKPAPQKAVGTVWTKINTTLRSSNSWYSKGIATVPAQTKLTLISKGAKMSKVKYGTKTGWVNTYTVSTTAPGAKVKPYSKPTTAVQRAANNVAPWCSGTTLKTHVQSYDSVLVKRGGYTGDAIDQMPVTETITLGKSSQGSGSIATTTNITSCMMLVAHRAYQYNDAKMNAGLQKYGGIGTVSRCMAELAAPTVMPKSSIVVFGCSAAQNSAAKKLLAGKTA